MIMQATHPMQVVKPEIKKENVQEEPVIEEPQSEAEVLSKSETEIKKYGKLTVEITKAPDGGEIPAFLEERKQEFITAMEDDLNTADALAAVFVLVRDINTAIANGAGKATLEACADIFDQLTWVLGLVYNRKTDNLDAEIEGLIEQRTAARKARDFAITIFVSFAGMMMCGMTDCIFYGLKPLQYMMMIFGLTQACVLMYLKGEKFFRWKIEN